MTKQKIKTYTEIFRSERKSWGNANPRDPGDPGQAEKATQAQGSSI